MADPRNQGPEFLLRLSQYEASVLLTKLRGETLEDPAAAATAAQITRLLAQTVQNLDERGVP